MRINTLTTELQQLFSQAFPKLNNAGQQQAKQLYHLLSNGEAISVQDFANEIKLTNEQADAILENWTGVSFDDNKNIDGFWGLSTTKTRHSFELNNHTLYTWCAWDLLFMPVIFQQTITAHTTCPVTDNEITLIISKNKIEQAKPVDAMITFIKPALEQLKANVTQSFCQYVFFVESEQAGLEWKKGREGGFLLDLDTGFDLGKNIINDVFDK